MPDDKREPQSYGSQADWVTGRTGQQVQNPKSSPPPEHAEFYDNRRDDEESREDQGGRVSERQLAESAENAEPRREEEGEHGPVSRVTARTEGAKRNSFFRKRDYE